MTHLLDSIPLGWSLVRDEDGWLVYDHAGHLLNEAPSAKDLEHFLNHEIRTAQEFAAFQWAMKGPMPAQA